MSVRGEVVLSCSDVSLSYRHGRGFLRSESVPVLNRVSFDLLSGQTLGIIGRNGAGKSSLLRLMAGIIEPDSGTVSRRGHLGISLLTLQLGLEQRLTGRENALLGCLLMGIRRREAKDLLPKIIEFSGLGPSIDDQLASYSSGMRVRLSFSVAFFTQADIMLIDEVLGVGDHEFQIKSRDALLAAVASDRTAVLVSHQEDFLAEVCDSLLWLENGRVAMHGATENVLKKHHDYHGFMASIAKETGRTLDAVRADPANRDPLKVIERMAERSPNRNSC